MLVGVIDLGTNSTRLLVADVEHGRVASELARESRVTRLGRGVDLADQLAAEAIEETCAAVADYVRRADELDVERTSAIATSAVRDATNADAFLAELRERFALRASTLTGEEEARLTYLGAVGGGSSPEGTLVVDVGGGSTEIVVGSGESVAAHASLQVGAVRHTERHLRSDPPTPAELEDLSSSVGEAIELTARGWGADREPVSSRPGGSSGDALSVRRPSLGIAVAGTATSLAAIDLRLDPYDPDAVQDHVIALETAQRMCSELATVPLAERREITGLHPDRAPTIVAGVVILMQVMRVFHLTEVRISERDLLHGAAVELGEDQGGA